MDAQDHNLCLVNMPVLVLEKILANIRNPSTIARSCKYLYEIVCDMEKLRRVMHISASDATSYLTIDADAVFDSIMNSHRPIKKIELRVKYIARTYYELNERQVERMIALIKHFGANITSLKFCGFVLPINFILELLEHAPELESFSLTRGKVMGSVSKSTTVTLQLPSIKALETDHYFELLDIVNLIPTGSLNYYKSSISRINQSTESIEVLTTLLTKQHNIKSLDLITSSKFDLIEICVDQWQLETLTFQSGAFDNSSRFVELLMCQMNLKELRLKNFIYNFSGSLFQWICTNLKKLQVFEVEQVMSIKGNAFEMLSELKQLRHFRTYKGGYLFDNEFQSCQFRSESIEKFEIQYWPEFSRGELLNKMVHSMVHNLPHLTHLKMRFRNFSALCFVLGHCTKIIHLGSYIIDFVPHELIQQHFPNIRSLELHNDINRRPDDIGQIMTLIVRAMPNLKSMSLLLRGGLKFDDNIMKEFINESKSLEYFYLRWFELHRELSTDDVVETIRCLTDQLKGYHIAFCPSTSPEDGNWHNIKDILSNEFYVRSNYHWNRQNFYLYKGVEEEFR